MNDKLRDLPEDAFSRADETDDAAFYARDRFVSHLDSLALATIERVIGELVVEEAPAILDLMASWDSHLPSTLSPSKVVGLGLNENELASNGALTEYVFHDLNRDPKLPFPDGAFDVALCTVSVDYMTRPLDVFRDVARTLKPGGLFLVTFSNRFFPPKVVKIWRDSAEEERIILVEGLFAASGMFTKAVVFMSRGKPRPRNDKYAHLGIPSDPVYAVYAERAGGPTGRRPVLTGARHREGRDEELVAAAKLAVKNTLQCPYCDVRLCKWAVPQTPFTEWPNEFFYVCFNDGCPYFVTGWDAMGEQGNPGSYRLMYDPFRDAFHPLPVPGRNAFRDGIIDEGLEEE